MRVIGLTAALAVSMVAITASAVPSFAQDCTCTATAGRDGVAGRFISANGQVLTGGPADYQPADAGTPITVGSEIAVGANSKARIVVGQTCRLSLDANTVTRVEQLTDNKLCVASNATGAPGATAGSGLPLGPILLGGGLLGGIAALALSGKGDDPVSQ